MFYNCSATLAAFNPATCSPAACNPAALQPAALQPAPTQTPDAEWVGGFGRRPLNSQLGRETRNRYRPIGPNEVSSPNMMSVAPHGRSRQKAYWKHTLGRLLRTRSEGLPREKMELVVPEHLPTCATAGGRAVVSGGATNKDREVGHQQFNLISGSSASAPARKVSMKLSQSHARERPWL